MGAGDFGERGSLRPGDQNQPGALRVGEGGDRVRVDAALLFEPGHRAQAGGIAFSVVQEVGPRSGQLQQPDGVPGGGSVEEHVVEVGDGVVVGEQGGELVERSDLGGA